MRVEIWSDVVCPWCYIGKRNFEAALAAFEHRDEVEVVWRSFELDPSASTVRDGDYALHLAGKYGVPRAQAEGMLTTMTSTAAGVGLELRFDRARGGNTFDAHRLLHLARERGVQDAVKERLLRAALTDGQAIGQRDVLVRLAGEAGLDAGEAAAALGGEAYSAAVRADEEQAAEFGITAVPFFVVDRTFGVPGAQPPEVLARALQRGWEKSRAPLVQVTAPEAGAACDGDACAT